MLSLGVKQQGREEGDGGGVREDRELGLERRRHSGACFIGGAACGAAGGERRRKRRVGTGIGDVRVRVRERQEKEKGQWAGPLGGLVMVARERRKRAGKREGAGLRPSLFFSSFVNFLFNRI